MRTLWWTAEEEKGPSVYPRTNRSEAVLGYFELLVGRSIPTRVKTDRRVDDSFRIKVRAPEI